MWSAFPGTWPFFIAGRHNVLEVTALLQNIHRALVASCTDVTAGILVHTFHEVCLRNVALP
jgi:hypothetical protein